MKIMIFNPYGTQKTEAGVFAATVRMLQDYGHQVIGLSCDGCLSQCDRSVVPELGFRRRLSECFNCTKDQLRLGEALKLSSNILSSYLSPSEVEETFRIVFSAQRSELPALTFQGESLAWLSRQSLKARFGSLDAAFDSEDNTKGIRELYLSMVRLMQAATNAAYLLKPDLALILGRDALSEAFAAGVKFGNSRFGLVCAAGQDNLISAFDSLKSSSEMIEIQNINSFRVSMPLVEWDKDLFASIRDLLVFFDIPVVQMTMFAANQA
jgi:hypothetical protein